MARRAVTNTFPSLGHPQYRILWAGSLFATLAFMMSFTIQPVVAFDLAGTNSAVGLVQLGMGSAMLLVGPFGGVIADRLSKRPLVFAGQTTVALVMLGTGMLIISDVITIALLAGTTALMGLAFSFMGPARQAWVGEMVEPALLPNAVAMSQLALNIARVAAPLLAALMLSVSAIGAGGAYIFMASLFSIVLLSTWMLPRTKARPIEERRSVRSELVDGIAHVARNPRLRLLMLFFFAIVVLGFSFQVVLPAMLERHLDHDASDLGLILTVNAVAGLTVSILIARIAGGNRAWLALFTLPVFMGAGFLVLAVAPNFEVALLSMLLLGPGQWSFMLVNNVLLMANSKPAYYGRVMALNMAAFGVQGVLATPFGLLADRIGERNMLAAVGFMVLGVAVAAVIAYQGVRRASERPVA